MSSRTRRLVFAILVGSVFCQSPTAAQGPKPNEQERRILRWQLVFNQGDGEDYARQLQALGAMLAIDSPDNGTKFLVIRDLAQRPAKGKIEELTQTNRIVFIDSDGESVNRLTKALKLEGTPGRVICIFPEKLEEELARKEREFEGSPLEAIRETRFKVTRTDKGYTPVVTEQSYR